MITYGVLPDWLSLDIAPSAYVVMFATIIFLIITILRPPGK